MATFSYKAKTADGRITNGKLDAEDQRTAVSQVQRMGYYVLDIRETGVASEQTAPKMSPSQAAVRWLWNPIFAGAPTQSLAVYYRMLATMIKSGLSLAQAMGMLQSQAGSHRLRKISGEAMMLIQNGGTLSEAFSRHPWMFSDLHINLIRAGETGGMLERSLISIADMLESELRIRQKLRMSTYYPKILLVAAVFIPALPKLVLDGFGAFYKVIVSTALPTLFFFTVVWMVYRIVYQIPAVQFSIDAIKVRIPRIGKMVKMFALSKFYRSFGAMSAAGVPLSNGLRAAADSSGNGYLAARLKKSIPMVEQGRLLPEALGATGVIPSLALNMLVIGEQSGNVDGMLEKAAEYTEGEAEVAIHQSTTFIGVFSYLVIAIYIAFIVITSWSGSGYIQGISELVK